MIKVIASDMDGTLLGGDHRLAPRTARAIRSACDAGIRFIVATGRDLNGALQELDGMGLVCDYIVGQIRSSAGCRWTPGCAERFTMY